MNDDGILEQEFNQKKDQWDYGVYTNSDTPVFLRIKNAASQSLVQSPPLAVEVYNGDSWEQGDGHHLGLVTTRHFKKLESLQACLDLARQTFHTPTTSFDAPHNTGNENE